MKLREYQAKKIFKQHGISIPIGIVTTHIEEVEIFAAELKRPVVLKPQLDFKGRGKLGIIAFADTPAEAADKANQLFNTTIKNESIDRLLVEEKVNIAEELYLAVVIDFGQRCPVIMVSMKGGVDIEELAISDPHLLLKIPINILHGLTNEHLTRIQEFSNPEIASISKKLFQIFQDHDAELVEINPLVKTKSGETMAIDAVLNVNDDSVFRHADLIQLREKIGINDPIAAEASANNWTYIDLPGDIAILSSGAGLTMTILDLINMAGGSAANFLDTAQIDEEGIYKAFQLLNKAKKARAILINVFAGLNQCDSLALGIRRYLTDHPINIPIVIRMIGNKEQIGHQILNEIGFKPYKNLEEAIEQIVGLSKKMEC